MVEGCYGWINNCGCEVCPEFKECIKHINSEECVNMWKEFNDGKTMDFSIERRGSTYKGVAFEDGSAVDTKEEYNFNLVAIEFQEPTPFETIERVKKYKGETNYGYIADISNNEIKEVYLLVSGYGWGETEIVPAYTEEYGFVESILKQIKAIEELN